MSERLVQDRGGGKNRGEDPDRALTPNSVRLFTPGLERRSEREELEEEEEGTFLKERAGRAGGRSLSWWWKASKCIDRCCPTGGDTGGVTERDAHRRR